MTKPMQIYKCDVCGNIVELVHSGKGQLFCCGYPMLLIQERLEDTGKEKHLPTIEKVNGRLKVKVGSIEHPMEEKHYIEWIEAITSNSITRKNLKPGDKPEAEFNISEDILKLRGYCNIHGLWATNNS